MHSNNKRDWADRIVDSPRWNIAILIVITVVAILGYYDPKWYRHLFSISADSGVSENAPGDRGNNSQSRDNRTKRRASFNQGDVVVVITSDDFFNTASAEALRDIVKTLEAEPVVESVMWLDRAPPLNIFGLPEPIFPRTDASPERFAHAKRNALRNPLIAGQMLSTDGKTLLLLVRIEWLNVRSDSDCTERIKQNVLATLARHSQVTMNVMLTGDVPMYLMIVSTQRANQVKYQLIGYGMIFLLALVLFRGFTAVCVTAFAPALGVFWSLSALRYLDLQENPFNEVILPIMISLIGFTDAVHMMVQIRKQRALGLTPIEATKKGLRDVGAACFFTLFTTSLGFASLGFAHNEIVREFGWCCVLGIGILFTAVIGSIPMATASRIGQNIHVGHDLSMIDKHIGKISILIDWVIRHARVVSWLGIGATLTFAGIALTLRPDDQLSNALPAGSEPQRAMQHLDSALGGLQQAEIFIEWKQDADPGQVIRVIEQVDQLLRNEKLLGSQLSIVRLIDALPGEGTLEERWSMVELLPPPLKDQFYKPDQHFARLTFRIQDTGIATYGPIFQKLEKSLKALEDSLKTIEKSPGTLEEDHKKFSIRLQGRAIDRWRTLYQIVVDLGSSLGGESIIILVLLAIVYRSFRLGLIAFVPNIFPLAFTGTILVFTGQPLELVSVCAFTVCLGIAVDDTIHFLTRYREELSTGKDEVQAIRSAFTGVGTGMIMTTIVLVAGFSTVLISEVRDHRVFCSMGALTLVAALFGDIFLLPALLVYFRPKKPTNSGPTLESTNVERER